ncbi:MAG: hypothetical protein LQ343_004448 [Gyalolechia ehrenbergii]|nr:MAG: hypothetical protein LQ343_004448 [Gyalolechia ehrenbergii]
MAGPLLTFGPAEHPNLELSPEERRYFGQLFSAADTDKIGVVTGEVAVKFFEKTKLPPSTLGEIWQMADTENRGLLTPTGFGLVLRLIGYAQSGRQVSPELALKPGGPLPRFDGIPFPHAPQGNTSPAPLQAQNSGPIRVPPLSQDKVAQYSSLFEESGAQGGILSGDTAKQIFERAQLPNEVLGRIWNLSDTEQKGALGLTEFIIAMHLLASYRSGSMRALPQILPAGLYEAASRRAIPRQGTGSRQASDSMGHPSAIPRQFSGASYQRPSSPATRAPYSQAPRPETPTVDQWAITPQDKGTFDQIFSTVDTTNRGFITGDQAVSFFSNSRLPEETLAQIWDLADINSEGRLNTDEFAVAMYLIRQQRSKTTGRDEVPQTLPPNLIPPSMRRQPPQPAQPTAPTFDNAANITAPKSAAEDLFGLDAFTSAAPRAPESVSDSSLYTASPPRTTASPQLAQQGQPSSVFKPFVPSSSFGQTIMTPQGTGTSSGTSPMQTRAAPQQRQPSTMDDLLGDNDPEVSKKLTHETSELANLSNQVSTLTGQMQESKNKRASTEQDLSHTQNSKRDFETRLASLRSAYEQEVRDVKELETQLATTKNECRKLQSDIAMIEGARQDLHNQRQQIVAALEAEQKENASLKERIRQANLSSNELKSQVEKLKSDLRQQKGLVAINKKQLATLEAELDKVRTEFDEASKEYSTATKELEESKKALEEGKKALEARSDIRSPPNFATPAASTTSMNPFFRRQSADPGSKGVSSPFTPSNVASPNQNAFDSFFGPSFGGQPSVPPPTSFQSNSPSSSREAPRPNVTSGHSERSSDGPDFPTPSGSPPPSTYDTAPQVAGEPPAPPQSRQITSSFLPFGKALERSGSEDSSVRANPPTSRMGEPSGTDTPTDRNTTEPQQGAPNVSQPPTRSSSLRSENFGGHGVSSGNEREPLGKNGDMPSLKEPQQDPLFGQPSAARDMPGGFPSDTTPPLTPDGKKLSSSGDTYTSSGLRTEIPIDEGKERSPLSAKEDFDAAFKDFGESSKAPMQSNSESSIRAFDGVGASKAAGEFPPIQEFGVDDESDSSSDRGFEDDFTPVSPPRTQQTAEKPQASQLIAPTFGDEAGSSLAPTRPPLTSVESNASQLPTPGAQMSPPTYDQAVASPESSLQPGQRKPSNQFPQEYKGLLPSRDDPTSPPPLSSQDTEPTLTTTSTEKSSNLFGQMNPDLSRQSSVTQAGGPGPSMPEPHAPMPPGASAAAFAYQREPSSGSQSQPPVPAKTAFDDFDNEFGDLSDAKEADEKGDEDFPVSHRTGLDEFNPTFESPTSTRTANVQPQVNHNSFSDFESRISSAQPSTSQQQPAQPSTSHDWDAIFAGLDTPQNNGVQSEPSQPLNQNGPPQLQGNKPALDRGVSVTTEHDDPLVKDLTSMGFQRDDCVRALEKYDYDQDKALEELSSKS